MLEKSSSATSSRDDIARKLQVVDVKSLKERLVLTLLDRPDAGRAIRKFGAEACERAYFQVMAALKRRNLHSAGGLFIWLLNHEEELWTPEDLKEHLAE